MLPPKKIGALKGTRTPDPLLRRQMLYPAELSAQMITKCWVKPDNANYYITALGDNQEKYLKIINFNICNYFVTFLCIFLYITCNVARFCVQYKRIILI